MKTIGKNLNKYRLEKKLTQKELGLQAGVSRSYISELESDTYDNVSILILGNLCKVLKVTPNELIPEEMWKGGISNGATNNKRSC